MLYKQYQLAERRSARDYHPRSRVAALMLTVLPERVLACGQGEQWAEAELVHGISRAVLRLDGRVRLRQLAFLPKCT
jgi:hypothetical protein